MTTKHDTSDKPGACTTETGSMPTSAAADSAPPTLAGPPSGSTGAPRGNINAAVHGIRSEAARSGLALGKLPPGCRHITRAVRRMRIDLEAAVVAQAGEVSLYASALIQSACRWETTARLAGKYLAAAADDLPADKRIEFSERVSKASDCRDKCLKALGLDRTAAAFDPASLYRLPAPGAPHA